MSFPWSNTDSNSSHRNDELARILERVVEIGLRGGWAEFQDTPLPLPRIQLSPRLRGTAEASDLSDILESPSTKSNQPAEAAEASTPQTPSTES